MTVQACHKCHVTDIVDELRSWCIWLGATCEFALAFLCFKQCFYSFKNKIHVNSTHSCSVHETVTESTKTATTEAKRMYVGTWEPALGTELDSRRDTRRSSVCSDLCGWWETWPSRLVCRRETAVNVGTRCLVLDFYSTDITGADIEIKMCR